MGQRNSKWFLKREHYFSMPYPCFQYLTWDFYIQAYIFLTPLLYTIYLGYTYVAETEAFLSESSLMQNNIKQPLYFHTLWVHFVPKSLFSMLHSVLEYWKLNQSFNNKIHGWGMSTYCPQYILFLFLLIDFSCYTLQSLQKSWLKSINSQFFPTHYKNKTYLYIYYS